jgi:hypothetical protein
MVVGRVREGIATALRPVRVAVGEVAAVPRRVAGRVAATERLPDAARAVSAYYANCGAFDYAALSLQGRAEDRMDELVAEGYAAVDRAVADAFGVDPDDVNFEYETKLLLPATLTLGAQYRRILSAAPDGFDPVERRVRPGLLGRVPFVGDGTHADGGTVDPEFSALVRDVDRVEEATRQVVLALLDGDMRDAINDEEYGDFEADVADDEADRRRVARIAQSTLQERVDERFGRFPDAVEETYRAAVEASEAHQDRDPEFRGILADVRDGVPGARDRMRREYRDAGFEEPPAGFSGTEVALPYFRTQYRRVGVIYDGMFDMYEAVGVPVDPAFRRAVVLAIVGAQVWLDDVDDFEADTREGQLTPVTAEYALADSESAAYERVVDVSERYFDRARRCAAESDSTLVGIAVEYIRISGDPTVLPGADGAPDPASPP